MVTKFKNSKSKVQEVSSLPKHTAKSQKNSGEEADAGKRKTFCDFRIYVSDVWHGR